MRAGRVLPVGGDRTVSYAEGGKSREFPPACPGGKKSEGKSLQHLLFPGGPPSRYWAGPTLLNFGDQTRTGAFSVVWS